MYLTLSLCNLILHPIFVVVVLFGIIDPTSDQNSESIKILLMSRQTGRLVRRTQSQTTQVGKETTQREHLQGLTAKEHGPPDVGNKTNTPCNMQEKNKHV